MCLHYDSALGDGAEEICFGEIAVCVEIEELKVLEEVGVETHVGEGFELYLVEQFSFKSG